MTPTHHEREDFPWIIAVVDHPQRVDSPAYVRSRTLMHKLVAAIPDWILAGDPYQDHHGGAVWVKDDIGWLCLQLPLGIEWAAQFCADPKKVDELRQYAARVVAAFPATLPGYQAFGYPSGDQVLHTPITDAAGIEAWTDSIFNASLPLPATTHTGVLPTGAGYHHYPKPIVDIDHFRYDDFQLFVTDSAGLPAAVVPVSPRGSGDGRVRLLAAHPQSRYLGHLRAGTAPGQAAMATEGPPGGVDGLLEADDPLAEQAFARQSQTRPPSARGMA
jgi:hypothetical protein